MIAVHFATLVLCLRLTDGKDTERKDSPRGSSKTALGRWCKRRRFRPWSTVGEDKRASSLARARRHYSTSFFRDSDLPTQDRIPRMDWTAFRSHLFRLCTFLWVSRGRAPGLSSLDRFFPSSQPPRGGGPRGWPTNIPGYWFTAEANSRGIAISTILENNKINRNR